VVGGVQLSRVQTGRSW